MEADTRRLALVSVALGICVVTLLPVEAGLRGALKSAGIPEQTFTLGFSTFSVFDVIQNILLFAPLGFLMAAGGNPESRSGRLPAILVSLALSAFVEWAQAWIPGRYPSCWDILSNAAGGALGAWAATRARSAVPSYF